MTTRSTTAIGVAATLALATLAGAAAWSGARADAAQRATSGAPLPDPSRAPDADDDDQPVTVTGEISATNASGEAGYQITVGGQATRLSVGPPWHFDTDPLAQFVGKTVTITGERSTGTPSPNASAKAKGKPAEGPEIDVFTVTSGGTTVMIRGAGKPPWAGGQKMVGTKQPGSKSSKVR
ncbi:MAG: hypothetical protein ABR525_02170 [Candidatus Limnocylindria bacterium]